MLSLQVRSPKYIERVVSLMKKEKTNEVKVVEEKKEANQDLTQTKEFWSNAVIS